MIMITIIIIIIITAIIDIKETAWKDVKLIHMAEVASQQHAHLPTVTKPGIPKKSVNYDN
jgi:hypothetical protein